MLKRKLYAVSIIEHYIVIENYVQYRSRVLAVLRQVLRGEGQRETSTCAARLGSHGNSDASVSAGSCYWPSRAAKVASETECGEVRCANISAGFRSCARRFFRIAEFNVVEFQHCYSHTKVNMKEYKF